MTIQEATEKLLDAIIDAVESSAAVGKAKRDFEVCGVRVAEVVIDLDVRVKNLVPSAPDVADADAQFLRSLRIDPGVSEKER